MKYIAENLGIALIILAIGGCSMMESIGSAKLIKAKAESKLIEAKVLTIETNCDTVVETVEK